MFSLFYESKKTHIRKQLIKTFASDLISERFLILVEQGEV